MDEYDYSFEASTLGWKPGYWPEVFLFIDAGNELLFMCEVKRNADGDIQYVIYGKINSNITVQVFND